MSDATGCSRPGAAIGIGLDYQDGSSTHCNVHVTVNGDSAGTLRIRQSDISTFNAVIKRGMESRGGILSVTGDSWDGREVAPKVRDAAPQMLAVLQMWKACDAIADDAEYDEALAEAAFDRDIAIAAALA